RPQPRAGDRHREDHPTPRAEPGRPDHRRRRALRRLDALTRPSGGSGCQSIATWAGFLHDRTPPVSTSRVDWRHRCGCRVGALRRLRRRPIWPHDHRLGAMCGQTRPDLRPTGDLAVPMGRRCSAQDRAGHHHTLDLVGALVDLCDLLYGCLSVPEEGRWFLVRLVRPSLLARRP
ncbi:MAG: hypothetical protein QOG58_5076, partial [Caballeronia sp.]|nr:hypothetical protein [Caballeronia sp.]